MSFDEKVRACTGFTLEFGSMILMELGLSEIALDLRQYYLTTFDSMFKMLETIKQHGRFLGNVKVSGYAPIPGTLHGRLKKKFTVKGDVVFKSMKRHKRVRNESPRRH